MSRIVRASRPSSVRRCLCLVLAASGCVEEERVAEDAKAWVADAAGSTSDASLVVGEGGSPLRTVSSDAAAARDGGSPPTEGSENGLVDATTSDRTAARDGGVLDRSPVAAPDGWVQAPNRCGVRFWGPPDLLEVSEQGIDSCVFHFRTADCEISGGSGAFSDPLTQDEGELDFDASTTRIDGREARLVQYRLREGGSQPFVAALNVPLPSPAGWQLAADLHAMCSSRASREQALLSIRTATIHSIADRDANVDAGLADASVSNPGSPLVPIVVGASGSVRVNAGEVFTIVMKFLGDDGTPEPLSSSPIVKWVGLDPTPSRLQTPGGPVRLFRFEARDVGAAELSFAGAARNDAGTTVPRIVTVYVHRP